MIEPNLHLFHFVVSKTIRQTRKNLGTNCVTVNFAPNNIGPLSVLTIHKIFSLACDWSKHVIKYWGVSENISQFPKPPCACCEKDLNDNKHNSLQLARKYARIFVLGHYLFLEAHSFPWATLSENCSLLGTNNDPGHPSIFSRQMEAIVYLSNAVEHKLNTACIRESGY